MSFRPTHYPCGNTDAHLAHEHADGPDGYHYICPGQEKRWAELTSDDQIPPWGLVVDQLLLRQQLDAHDKEAENEETES